MSIESELQLATFPLGSRLNPFTTPSTLTFERTAISTFPLPVRSIDWVAARLFNFQHPVSSICSPTLFPAEYIVCLDSRVEKVTQRGSLPRLLFDSTFNLFYPSLICSRSWLHIRIPSNPRNRFAYRNSLTVTPCGTILFAPRGQLVRLLAQDAFPIQ